MKWWKTVWFYFRILVLRSSRSLYTFSAFMDNVCFFNLWISTLSLNLHWSAQMLLEAQMGRFDWNGNTQRLKSDWAKTSNILTLLDGQNRQKWRKKAKAKNQLFKWILHDFMLQIDASSLISASVMAAPCALAFSKLSFPETEESPFKPEETVKVACGCVSIMRFGTVCLLVCAPSHCWML